MAGVMALINGKAGKSQGNPNAALYTLAATQTYAACSSDTEYLVEQHAACYFQ